MNFAFAAVVIYGTVNHHPQTNKALCWENQRVMHRRDAPTARLYGRTRYRALPTCIKSSRLLAPFLDSVGTQRHAADATAPTWSSRGRLCAGGTSLRACHPPVQETVINRIVATGQPSTERSPAGRRSLERDAFLGMPTSKRDVSLGSCLAVSGGEHGRNLPAIHRT